MKSLIESFLIGAIILIGFFFLCLVFVFVLTGGTLFHDQDSNMGFGILIIILFCLFIGYGVKKSNSQTP